VRPTAGHIDASDFENLYLQLRKKEGRVYTDEELAVLPDIAKDHVHFREWQMRKQSCQMLMRYLKKKQKPAKIFEVGCGNGWLSHQLSNLPDCHVIGTDINFTELQQASKVFHLTPNLYFIYSHLDSDVFEEKQFDSVVFAASIQYFPSLTEIIRKSLRLLKADGEIHILDSFFYPLSELNAAKKRSLLYFEAAGFPEMVNWYFHHSLDELEQFNYSMLYDPNSLLNKFTLNKSPFPWICIKH